MSTEPPRDELTPEYFAERVAAGIALMEREAAGSTARINLETMDVWSACFCPLAQAFGGGSFDAGAGALGLDESDTEEMAVYGFNLSRREIRILDGGLEQSGSEMYAPLTEAWRVALLNRRAQTPA